MKIKMILFSIFVTFVLSSCVFEDISSTLMGVEIEKLNVQTDEEIEITVFFHNAYFNNKTDFIVHINGLPKKYDICEGAIYEPWTTEQIVCIFPAQLKGSDGIIRLKISFDKAGEYELKLNGCSINDAEICNIWNEEHFTYKFTVTE